MLFRSSHAQPPPEPDHFADPNAGRAAGGAAGGGRGQRHGSGRNAAAAAAASRHAAGHDAHDDDLLSGHPEIDIENLDPTTFFSPPLSGVHHVALRRGGGASGNSGRTTSRQAAQTQTQASMQHGGGGGGGGGLFDDSDASMTTAAVGAGSLMGRQRSVSDSQQGQQGVTIPTYTPSQARGSCMVELSRVLIGFHSISQACRDRRLAPAASRARSGVEMRFYLPQRVLLDIVS